MAPGLDAHHGLPDELGPRPVEGRGALGEGRERIELRQCAGGCLQRAQGLDQRIQYHIVELALAGERALARAQHFLLEALELRRDEALGGFHRLAPQVILRHALGIAARNLDEEPLHAVESELESMRCRCAHARALRARAGIHRCGSRCGAAHQAPRHGRRDNVAVAQQRRGLRRDGRAQECESLRVDADPRRAIAQRAAQSTAPAMVRSAGSAARDCAAAPNRAALPSAAPPARGCARCRRHRAGARASSRNGVHR